jgi:hypothetical protein
MACNVLPCRQIVRLPLTARIGEWIAPAIAHGMGRHGRVIRRAPVTELKKKRRKAVKYSFSLP